MMAFAHVTVSKVVKVVVALASSASAVQIQAAAGKTNPNRRVAAAAPAPAAQQPEAAAAPDVVVLDRADRISQACEEIAKELEHLAVPHNQILNEKQRGKFMGKFEKNGLISLDPKQVSQSQTGSHKKYHGPGGMTQIVIPHKSSPPVKAKEFIEQMQSLASVTLV